jgi:hypothetical protein
MDTLVGRRTRSSPGQGAVTPEDLAGWVASLIDEDVAVREMVEAMVTKHSEAFDPPPD